MREKHLLRVSLVFSLIGILALFYLTFTLEPTRFDIGHLTKSNLDDVVKVKGIIESYGETPGLYLINVKDDTGRITIILFKDEELELMEGLEVEIVGQVTEYQNKLEIIAKEIVI